MAEMKARDGRATVAVIGAGNMGSAMTRNLLTAGPEHERMGSLGVGDRPARGRRCSGRGDGPGRR
jgi:hypothetical protein